MHDILRALWVYRISQPTWRWRCLVIVHCLVTCALPSTEEDLLQRDDSTPDVHRFSWMVYLGIFLDGHLGQLELVMIYTYFTTSYQITKPWISLNFTKWKKHYIQFVHPPFEDTNVVSWRRDKRQRIQCQSRSSSLMFDMNLVSWTTTRTVLLHLHIFYI